MDINAIIDLLESAQAALTQVESDKTWQEISTSDENYPELLTNFNDTTHYLSETIRQIKEQSPSEISAIDSDTI